MTRQQRIESILTAELQPSALTVTDESHLHAGHAGARPEGETHFKVEITTDAFSGKSRVDSHRHINQLLQPEFDTGLHALAISAKAG